MSNSTVIARKSPWAVGLASFCMIAVALGFTLVSVHEGFDISSRPWMAHRLWIWFAAAYVASPLLVIFVLAHFASLVRQRFACIAVEGDRLIVAGLSIRSVPISALKSVEIRGGMLLLTLDGGKQIGIGRLGIVGGTEAVLERLIQLKP